MRFDELTQSGREDAADYYQGKDYMYSLYELSVPVVFGPQTDHDAAAPAPTTFGLLIEWLDIAPGKSHMPQ
jgi:hypothetical protein